MCFDEKTSQKFPAGMTKLDGNKSDLSVLAPD